MTTYHWGQYGVQGQERQDREEALAKRRREREQQVAELRGRIPAWEDGIRQTEALLEEARARLTEARAATGAAWDELERACYYQQRGECAYSERGQPIADINRAEVGGPKARWDDAREKEQKALARVNRLEFQKDYFAGLIGSARSTT